MASAGTTRDQLLFVGSSGAGNEGRTLLEVIPLREGLIGSAPSCEFHFDDPFMTPEHGRLFRIGDRWAITQTAVAPVFVDGHAPFPGQGLVLEPGALIEVADTCLLVGGGAPRPEIRVDDPTGPGLLAKTLPEGDVLKEYLEHHATAMPIEWADQLASDALTVRFERGFVLEATVRETGTTTPPQLRRMLFGFLAHPACTPIERLVVATETCHGDALENARMVLQAIAAARCPMLRRIGLGVVELDHSKLETDLAALRSVTRLETTGSELARRPGVPSIVILDADGWPARRRGERIELEHQLCVSSSGETLVGAELADADLTFVDRGAGRWLAWRPDEAVRHLRTGDELKGPGYLVRFEI